MYIPLSDDKHQMVRDSSKNALASADIIVTQLLRYHMPLLYFVYKQLIISSLIPLMVKWDTRCGTSSKPQNPDGTCVLPNSLTICANKLHRTTWKNTILKISKRYDTCIVAGSSHYVWYWYSCRQGRLLTASKILRKPRQNKIPWIRTEVSRPSSDLQSCILTTQPWRHQWMRQFDYSSHG